MYSYPREQIEQLLPCLWDVALEVKGIPNPNAAPDDMPKAQANKAHTGDHMAHVADVWRAWEKAVVPLDERRAIFLHLGLGWTQEDAAETLGVNQSTVLRRANRGVGRLAEFLNGEPLEDEALAAA